MISKCIKISKHFELKKLKITIRDGTLLIFLIILIKKIAFFLIFYGNSENSIKKTK